eukprot:611986-Rhodomonas_salina.1
MIFVMITYSPCRPLESVINCKFRTAPRSLWLTPVTRANHVTGNDSESRARASSKLRRRPVLRHSLSIPVMMMQFTLEHVCRQP